MSPLRGFQRKDANIPGPIGPGYTARPLRGRSGKCSTGQDSSGTRRSVVSAAKRRQRV